MAVQWDEQPAPLWQRKEIGGLKKELSPVSGKYWRKISEQEGWGSQERRTVISKHFFALSCVFFFFKTKAARQFLWRIRLVAFLWLLTSGGFALCLESQWSNRRMSVCGTVYWFAVEETWGSFFFVFLPQWGLFVLWLISSHTCGCTLVFFALPECCHHSGSAVLECQRGSTWAHGRKLALIFHQRSFTVLTSQLDQIIRINLFGFEVSIIFSVPCV